MINFLDIKDTLQSIIKNKEVLQTDVLSLDALRAMVQLRNTSEIEVGSGVKEPGNYLNEIAEGAEGFASSEVNIVLNDELFFWGNDGNPMEYVSTRDRFLRPRGMGGENGDGGYTGIGTRTLVAKHGLPYYFLSIEDLKYYVRCVRIPNIPDTFDAERIGKKVTEWHLDEYQISQEEYMTLASFSKEDNIWTSKYFNEVPTMMCVVRLWDDFENLLPKKSYNVDKIMQRVGEQQMEHHDFDVNFFFHGVKYSKKEMYHPTTVMKTNIKGESEEQFGTRRISDLPLIKDNVDVYGDGSLFEVRGYTAIALKTDSTGWSKLLNLNGIDKYSVVRGGISRARHGRVIYVDKRGTCHAISDLGQTYLGVFIVFRRKSGKSSYEKGIKSSGVPPLVQAKAKEVFDEYTKEQGAKAKVTKRPQKAEDTQTVKIGNQLLLSTPTEISKRIASNIAGYTNYELTPNQVMDKDIITFGDNNKYKNRQVDMMFKVDGDDEPICIIEFAFDQVFDHIDRVIAWGSGKRMAKHIVLVLPSFNSQHYRDYINDQYVPKPGCNFIVTTYSALELNMDMNPFKL